MSLPAKPTSAESSLRVVCFLPDLDGGGAQRTMVNLVNALPEFGVQPILAVARGGGRASAWLSDEAKMVDFGLTRTRSAFLPLRRLIKKTKPNLVFSTMVDGNIMASLAAKGLCPVIIRETNSHRARGDLSWLRKILIHYTYRRATHVVALSSGVATELTEDYGLQPSRISTIGNPVDIDALATRVNAARSEPSPFPAGPEKRIISIGRLTEQKGFDLLLKALAQTQSAACLHILGDGKDRVLLEQQVTALGLSGRVFLEGFQEDIGPWLAHADLYVLSSRWEGFGHVLVEAMAAGLPVLSTRAPHGPADIIADGQTGVLVDCSDVDGLAEGIDTFVLQDALRDQIAKNGHHSCKRFALKKIAARYASIFENHT